MVFMRTINIILVGLVTYLVSGCIRDFGKDSISFSEKIDASNSETVSYLRSAIEQNPEIVDNYIRLANIRIKEGKNVEAKSLLKTAYGRDPENEKVVSGLALRYLEDREYYQAFALLKTAEERGISSLGLYKNFAKANYMTGDFENIPFYLNKALQFDKNDWELIYLKGEVARFRKDSIEAFNNYERAYALHPSDTVFNQMHDYALELQNLDRMNRYLSKSFLNHSESSDLLIRAGAFYRVKGEIDTSFYLYRKVIDMEPEASTAYDQMAENFYDRRRYDSAIHYASKAVSLEPEAINPRLIRARAYDKMYDYSEAQQEYINILELDSTFTIASNELAKLRRKIAYLRDIERIRKQKADFQEVKTLKSKKALPK
jgi:tetratricopeptide (TPR) repeat protein